MQIIDRHPDAPWLPSGGVAEVVLAGLDDEVAGPVGLVRLLITDNDGRIFCVPRIGGRPGWDIPTAPVGRGEADAAVDELTVTVFGSSLQVVLAGAVRNVVPAEVEYEWPSPVTYFCVYRPATALSPVIDGVWLTSTEATAELADRHWWPLVHAAGRIRIWLGFVAMLCVWNVLKFAINALLTPLVFLRRLMPSLGEMTKSRPTVHPRFTGLSRDAAHTRESRRTLGRPRDGVDHKDWGCPTL